MVLGENAYFPLGAASGKRLTGAAPGRAGGGGGVGAGAGAVLTGGGAGGAVWFGGGAGGAVWVEAALGEQSGSKAEREAVRVAREERSA